MRDLGERGEDGGKERQAGREGREETGKEEGRMAALEEVGGSCLPLLASWTLGLSGLPCGLVLTNVASLL